MQAMIRGRIIFQEGGNDMIRVSKEWTNDYGAYLTGDDNDLKIKNKLTSTKSRKSTSQSQSQHNYQRSKVKEGQPKTKSMVKGRMSKPNPKGWVTYP